VFALCFLFIFGWGVIDLCVFGNANVPFFAVEDSSKGEHFSHKDQTCISPIRLCFDI